MALSFFAFPLNLFLALLWAGGIFMAWRHCGKSSFVRFMLSRKATVIAITLLIIFSLIIGITGHREWTMTWLFAAVLLYFQTVLLFVILRGWKVRDGSGFRPGGVRWRFLMNHAGLLLAVSSAFWGAPDSSVLRVSATLDTPVREAYRMDGTSEWLSYSIELKDFKVETYENGVPSMFEASLLVDDEPVILKVNKPHSVRFGEDIYLAGYDSAAEDSGYCIVQIVREPWKYTALIGILLMMSGALLMFVRGPERRKTNVR